MIRLFVIEDHLDLVLGSLRFMFRPKRNGIEIAGSAQTPEEAVKNANSASFDIFILDLFIPDHTPVDNIRMLKRHFPDKPIIVYTGAKSSSWGDRMQKEGASAFVSKVSTREVIGLSIKRVAAGEHFFISDPSISANEQSIEPCASELTPVECKIVRLLSKGLTHKVIADQMGISRSMIEKILKRIRENHHVNNNVELMRILATGSSL